jgi:hypothetical protein
MNCLLILLPKFVGVRAAIASAIDSTTERQDGSGKSKGKMAFKQIQPKITADHVDQARTKY